MFRRIVVPLDGSQLAERALPFAQALAQAMQGEITFVRVPDPVIASGLAPTLTTQYSLENARREAADYLTKVKQGFERFGLTPQAEVVPGVVVAEAIVEYAAQASADLIVTSSHGRSGVSRWVYGSVAERVLQHASCPVLVLRSDRPLARLLITFDGSSLAEQALAPGLAVAAACRSSAVTLLRAIPAPPEGGEAEAEQRAAREYLGALSARGQVDGAEFKLATPFEPAANAILEHAEQEEIDLIVMATHGRTGLQRWRYGSVTEKVLRGTACSMLVVRPPQPG
jgi:nucleotide-binding universal stress UspA family protein